MKILLTTLNSKFIHTNLAIRYLKSYTKDLVDADIREYTINNDLDYILKDIYKNDYDVILFSTYIWNVLDIVKLCENIKKVKPNTIIGLGGPEVTYDSENAMEKYPFVDYILCGEGELVFRDLVMYLQGNKNIEDVEGIVYRNNGEIVVNRPKELLQNLDEIPSPYENLDPKEYENRIVYYETSRGCPFNCQYCLSSTLKGLRYFSIDRVKKDLKALIDARVSQIKFIDRTFNANKKFAKEIMNFLMENDNDYTTYHFEVTAHLLDDDMLEFLSNCKEGLFQFEIGVQTTNQKVLDAVGRRDDFTKLSKVVKKIASYRNIHQHLDLIAGLPYEDYASFENSFNDVFNLGIEHLQLGFLKMIKGTGVRKTANEHGYKYKDYPPYEVLYNNYISYVFFIEYFIGGAHPNHLIWTVNYDIICDKFVTIDDLVKYNNNILNIFSKISRNELMHNKDIVDISMLMEGTMPNTLNYSNFVFSNDGIIIYFSYYQVAPYSSGMFNVLINYKYL